MPDVDYDLCKTVCVAYRLADLASHGPLVRLFAHTSV
jgi:hypothetical protein